MCYETKRIVAHDLCPMELRISGPHIGLYCQAHNKWLKWLTDGEARICLENNLPVEILITAKSPDKEQHKPTDKQYIKVHNKDTAKQFNRLKKSRRWTEFKKLKRQTTTNTG